VSIGSAGAAAKTSCATRSSSGVSSAFCNRRSPWYISGANCSKACISVETRQTK